MFPDRCEAGLTLQVTLVHIETSINFDLEAMPTLVRCAVNQRRMTPGIGLISSHTITQPRKQRLRPIDNGRRTRCSVEIAKHDIGKFR